MRKFLFALLLLPIAVCSQSYQQPDASQIRLKLKKLNFLGSVLYVAAHPDDENTSVITYLANGRLATTAYLSLTRGDGGQNLLGPEIREQLGLIRTQELLAARSIDGGLQFFTRANDFGFSKSADEAFRIWGKEQVLSDVVRVFRQYQPDVIITRFPPDERAGHGHHTASAMLAGEAFEIAGNPEWFPDQVQQFGTWQPKRLYTNTGRWWNTSINENTPGVITLDVGGYNPLLGKSYLEISALSSSQHKSQGWGRAGRRGRQPEYLEHMKGEAATSDIFDGINTTWSRVKGGDKVQRLVERVLQEFKAEEPWAIVPLLLEIRKEIQSLPESVWKTRKLEETEQLIQDCLGLFAETSASWYYSPPGAGVTIDMEVINRSSFPVSIEKISSPQLKWDTLFSQPLQDNVSLRFTTRKEIPASAEYSDPYWLKHPMEQGIFTVKDPAWIGLPQNPPAVTFAFTIRIGGKEDVVVTRPLIYKWVDPVKGELRRPFEIVPPVTVNLSEKVVIFNDDRPREINVTLRSSHPGNVEGRLKLVLPEGWRAEPSFLPFTLARAGDEQSASFKLFPPSSESTAEITAVAEVNGASYGCALQVIQYDHIPVQTLLPPAKAKVVRLDLKKAGNTVAYIAGAGDAIPAALRNMGYEVWEMQNEDVTPKNLEPIDAVVLGVRALNTNERIPFIMPYLLDYVKNGGTLIVQYNTSSGLQTQSFSPYPIQLSRERVTEEDAPVTMVLPDHEVLNHPNKITTDDFKGWVQERGLYFPNTWDEQYAAPLSMNDTNETPKRGSLLVARYGKGYYVYTGLSFFRELPEGVPGAYKLFANMISLGKSTKAQGNVKKKNASR